MVLRRDAALPVLLDPAVDALEGLLNVIHRVGEREPQVTFAPLAERGPGETRDAGVRQQRVRERARIAASAADVGERVEGPVRLPAAKAGDGVQPLDDHAAPPPELLPHPFDALLVAAQGLDGGDLAEA